MQKRKTRNHNDNISPRERACLFILVHAWVRLHQMTIRQPIDQDCTLSTANNK